MSRAWPQCRDRGGLAPGGGGHPAGRQGQGGMALPRREPGIPAEGARRRRAGLCSDARGAAVGNAVPAVRPCSAGLWGCHRAPGHRRAGLVPCSPSCEPAVLRAHPATRGQHVACPRSPVAAAAAPGLCWRSGMRSEPSGTASAGSRGWRVWLHAVIGRGADCTGQSGIGQPAVRAAGFTSRTPESKAVPRVGSFRGSASALAQPLYACRHS